jgi:hypothetical protein
MEISMSDLGPRIASSLGLGAIIALFSVVLWWGDTNVSLYSWEIAFNVGLGYYAGRTLADEGFAPSGGNGVPALLLGLGTWLVLQLVLSALGVSIVMGSLERGLIRGAITAATMFLFSGSFTLSFKR